MALIPDPTNRVNGLTPDMVNKAFNTGCRMASSRANRANSASRVTQEQDRPEGYRPAEVRRIAHQRLAYQTATAMLAETAPVTSGSAHCGGKCEPCAKVSPMKVATAAIVACR